MPPKPIKEMRVIERERRALMECLILRGSDLGDNLPYRDRVNELIDIGLIKPVSLEPGYYQLTRSGEFKMDMDKEDSCG